MAVCFSLVAVISGLCSILFSGVTVKWKINRADKSVTNQMFIATIAMWILTATTILIANSYIL